MEISMCSLINILRLRDQQDIQVEREPVVTGKLGLPVVGRMEMLVEKDCTSHRKDMMAEGKTKKKRKKAAKARLLGNI